jgi:hypothetical protein
MAKHKLLENLKDESVYTETKSNFVSLNQHISDVSNAGTGSQRVVPVEVRKGELKVGNDQVRWEMDTEALILEPGTKIDYGNLFIASNLDVDAYETSNAYVIENEKVMFNFTKIGDEDNPVSIDADRIINNSMLKPGNVDTGTFDFTLNINATSSSSGVGYTKLENRGYGLDKASVKAHINDTTNNFEYDIVLTLWAGADYLTVDVENINFY